MTSHASRGHATVLFVQGYVPKYRQALFEGLRLDLATDGVDFRVATPNYDDAISMRGDGTTVDGMLRTPGRTWTRSIGFGQVSSYGSAPLLSQFDAVVVPAAASSFDFHWALFGPGRSARKVGAFGHIGAYVKAPNSVDQWIETRMLRRCDRVFAYTLSGGNHAVSVGVPPDSVTVVHNTIDTAELERAVNDVTLSQVDAFKAAEELGRFERVFGYLGALDYDKGIVELAGILDAFHNTGSNVKVLVAGQGPAQHLLKSAQQRGQVSLLGYADARAKALMAATCESLINPGRIGLVAVDALTMRLPLVTCLGAAHAPEADYLVEGESLFTGPQDHDQFVEWLSAQDLPRPNATPPTMEAMVSHFSAGIHALLR